MAAMGYAYTLWLCMLYVYAIPISMTKYDYDSQFINGKLMLSTAACASRTKPELLCATTWCITMPSVYCP